MSFIEQHSIPIFFALLFIILLLLAVIYLINKSSSNEEANAPSGWVPLEKHKEILKKREELRDKSDNCESSSFDISKYDALQEEYDKACGKIATLTNENKDLLRDNIELNTLLEKYKKRGEETPTLKKHERESAPSKKEPQVILYASFPRLAGSNLYFSDLTENQSDDSFFELKVSDGTGKAVFRPLDFMKIRNYDPAMAAITTEGVKPNVASTILRIEPGKAHLEGKDWIIDEPAKIILA